MIAGQLEIAVGCGHMKLSNCKTCAVFNNNRKLKCVSVRNILVRKVTYIGFTVKSRECRDRGMLALIL